MGMKAVTITIPEELDARAAAEARRRGISKSELIRRGLDAVLPPEREVPGADDAASDAAAAEWRALAGFGPEGVTSTPDDIDEVVYGR
jgi:hypothetical protein